MRGKTVEMSGEPSTILGLSAGFHDSAACLVVDGEIVAAVEQERLSRSKHDAAFPGDAVATCLRIAGVEPSDVDYVAINEKPVLVAQRYLASRLRAGPAGLVGLARSFPLLAREHLLIGQKVHTLFEALGARTPQVLWAEHHASHAAAAFYPSPFDHAAVVTVDGVGEWATASVGHGRAHRIALYEEMRFPDSVGMLYSAFTAYCGFRVNSGEGELMGLAPFGQPIYRDRLLDEVVTINDDGSIHLDQRYFRYIAGSRTTSRRFHQLFGGPPRPMGAEPTQREADLAASVQSVTEDIVSAMVKHARDITGESDVCLAGGVALNCVANGRLARETDGGGLWIQPAAGDAGGALGAALHVWHEVLEQHRSPRNGTDSMSGALLGPAFSRTEVRGHLDDVDVAFEEFDDESGFFDAVVRRLEAGEVVGWFSGRMEYGPRALGARSILADPRRPGVQRRLNELVKERQSFRPFAPAVLAERCDDWFVDCPSSPYMLLTAQVKPERLVAVDAEPETLLDRVDVVRSEIPGCTHVDGSARVQTVGPSANPSYRRLLEAFESATGCPVLLNTSFNGRAEPIVCTPEDALRSARRIGLDALAIEGFIVSTGRAPDDAEQSDLGEADRSVLA